MGSHRSQGHSGYTNLTGFLLKKGQVTKYFVGDEGHGAQSDIRAVDSC